MEPSIVRVISVRNLTHDVLEIRTEKPKDYTFIPGQATELALNRKGWEEEKRPFTFTGIPSDEYLEFIIKVYPSHHGMTNALSDISIRDSLIIGEPWGAIRYRGKGLFIAGGAGITPFISIFRQLANEKKLAGNKLLFANKTRSDIILESELNKLLAKDLIHILSHEVQKEYCSGFVTGALIKESLIQNADNVYLCGPPPMMDAVMIILQDLGISQHSITLEI